MKALKDKNETLKKQAEEAEAAAADLKKKLRAAEGEAKKAQVGWLEKLGNGMM